MIALFWLFCSQDYLLILGNRSVFLVLNACLSSFDWSVGLCINCRGMWFVAHCMFFGSVKLESIHSLVLHSNDVYGFLMLFFLKPINVLSQESVLLYNCYMWKLVRAIVRRSRDVIGVTWFRAAPLIIACTTSGLWSRGPIPLWVFGDPFSCHLRTLTKGPAGDITSTWFTFLLSFFSDFKIAWHIPSGIYRVGIVPCLRMTFTQLN